MECVNHSNEHTDISADRKYLILISDGSTYLYSKDGNWSSENPFSRSYCPADPYNAVAGGFWDNSIFEPNNHPDVNVTRPQTTSDVTASGSVEGRITCPKLKNDLNTVLTCFSPISKDKKLLMPDDNTEIDFLIATDCISEGQNLQDCDYLINYDIHWNPVRIIQRFGRIDRIGSKNKVIMRMHLRLEAVLM